ncbi:response regulator transcription factor [Sorangium sp. So ce693]|uniref:response regulator transcription factor n=1 Tax=Sorangium sp. So ce693 TaxID=3133318 RepID=UPI003F6284F9
MSQTAHREHAHENEGRSVLVVDDEDAFRDRLVRALAERGFEAFGVPSAAEAIRHAQLETPECAVVDLRMPRASGLHAVRKLHELDPTTRIVVLTGYGSIATALDAVRSGAVHYLTKPADIDEIVAAFDHDGSPADEPPPTSVPSLERVEWEHIDRVLVSCGGNITQAAALLGLHRRSLQRKLGKRPSP